MARGNNRGKRKKQTEKEINEEILGMREARSYEDKLNRAQARHFTFKPGLRLKGEKQKSFVNKIKENQITIVKGSAGTGKAQPLGADILTPDGYIKMGDIYIGDEVVSVDGKPTKVIGVFPQGEKEIYKVTFSDGTSTECCGEHLWFTQTYKEKNNREKKGEKTYKSEKPGKVRNTIDIMNSLFTKKGDKNHSIPTCSAIEFGKKELLIEPYLLGCLLSDGIMRCGQVLTNSKDLEAINEYKNLMPQENVLNNLSEYNYSFSAKIRNTGNSQLLNKSRELNLYGCGAETKFIPEVYKFGSVYQRIELLRGLMDTDGYISKDGIIVEYSSMSIKLINDLRFVIESLGGIGYLRSKIPTYTHKEEKKKGKRSYTLTLCMPSNINPFKLSKKKNLVTVNTKYAPKRFIVNIESVGIKQAQCIMVEDVKSLYLTNNCIVTHNTFCALKVALELLRDENSDIERILLVKPIVEGGQESIGFLPGGLDDKLEPYKASFVSNMRKLIGDVATVNLFEKEVVKFVYLGHVRGGTFENAVTILDEAQNATISGMKLFISRKSEESKLIIMGDAEQTDLKLRNGEETGLDDAFERLQKIKGISFMEFGDEDIVRSKILKEIMMRYRKPTKTDKKLLNE